MLFAVPNASAQTSGADARRYPPVTVAPAILPATTSASTSTTSTTTTIPVTVQGVVVTQPPTTAKIEPAPAIKTEVRGAVLRNPAVTGSNVYPLAVAGLALFGLGSAFVVGARRRKQAS